MFKLQSSEDVVIVTDHDTYGIYIELVIILQGDYMYKLRNCSKRSLQLVEITSLLFDEL